jgi:hypothetical protein
MFTFDNVRAHIDENFRRFCLLRWTASGIVINVAISREVFAKHDVD